MLQRASCELHNGTLLEKTKQVSNLATPVGTAEQTRHALTKRREINLRTQLKRPHREICHKPGGPAENRNSRTLPRRPDTCGNCETTPNSRDRHRRETTQKRGNHNLYSARPANMLRLITIVFHQSSVLSSGTASGTPCRQASRQNSTPGWCPA